jgi:hypothetical protein
MIGRTKLGQFATGFHKPRRTYTRGRRADNFQHGHSVDYRRTPIGLGSNYAATANIESRTERLFFADSSGDNAA